MPSAEKSLTRLYQLGPHTHNVLSAKQHNNRQPDHNTTAPMIAAQPEKKKRTHSLGKTLTHYLRDRATLQSSQTQRLHNEHTKATDVYDATDGASKWQPGFINQHSQCTLPNA